MIDESKSIFATWGSKNKKHYLDLGYKFTKFGDVFEVKIEDLTKCSKSKVNVICDYCGKISERTYATYIKGKRNKNQKDCCKECVGLKILGTFTEKYGVDNPSQLNDFEEKRKETNLKKYGVEYVTQREDFKERKKNTCKKKYGVEYPIQNKRVLNNLEKYNVEYPMQTESIRKKYSKTMIKRYGVEIPFKNKEIKEKAKETLKERYGVENPSYLELFREKARQSSLKKYGVEYPIQSKEVLNKMLLSTCTNGSVRQSKQEITICDIISEIYGKENCKKNFPLDKLIMDCMLKLNEEKIDIECDGWYWHKTRQQKDRRRNCYVIKNGYKVLRIKYNKQIPTKEQLIEAIDYLVKGNHSYKEIILDI